MRSAWKKATPNNPRLLKHLDLLGALRWQTYAPHHFALQLFDVEKTLVDCVKFRNKIGMDIVLEALQPVQLGKILDRDPQYLRINFLSKMMKTGELIYRFPDRPAHPQQAYKVPEKNSV